MARTSNRELARQIGVSETAVRRAEKAGRIKREANGAWDPAKVKAAWEDNTNQAQQRPAAGAKIVRRIGLSLDPIPQGSWMRFEPEPESPGFPTHTFDTCHKEHYYHPNHTGLSSREAELQLQFRTRPWRRCAPTSSAARGHQGRPSGVRL